MSNHPHEQLSAYLDNELQFEERIKVEAHLADCAACRELLEDFAAIRTDLLGSFSTVQAPEQLERTVRSSIAAGMKPQAALNRGLRVVIGAALMLSILFGVFVVTFLSKPLHGLWRVGVAVLYAASHMASNMPFVTSFVIICSILLLSVSVFSMRKLLRQTASAEGW